MKHPTHLLDFKVFLAITAQGDALYQPNSSPAMPLFVYDTHDLTTQQLIGTDGVLIGGGVAPIAEFVLVEVSVTRV